MSKALEQRVEELEAAVELLVKWMAMSAELQCEIVAKMAGDHPDVAKMRGHLDKLKVEVGQ